MLKRLNPASAGLLSFSFAGRRVEARADESVAAALLAAGIRSFRRSAVTGQPRGPYCMMGICFECLVDIDGHPNRQACLVPVAAGMRVEPGRSE
jgi:predicted molibdopterin-dependent oxidoreductase YjgC